MENITYGANNVLQDFISNTIQLSIPWLIAMAAIIILDLIVGLRKAYFCNEEVRFSKACRRTINKSVCYFWFVGTVSLIDTAAHIGLNITTWACLIVCGLELISVISNFLKTKGYKFNTRKGIDILVRKTLKLNKDDIGDIGNLIEADTESVQKEKESV